MRDTKPRGGLCFDTKILHFNVEDDNLLNDDEYVYIVDTRGSL